MSIFKTLKRGDKVKDSWYGPGVVKKKTQRNCVIQLVMKDEPWRYDREHVNMFITKEKK